MNSPKTKFPSKHSLEQSDTTHVEKKVRVEVEDRTALEEIWNGVIQKEIKSMPEQTETEEEHLKKALFAEEEVIIAAGDKTIGNVAGMSLLKRIKALERNDRMRQRNEQMYHSVHDLHTIRARALDQWAGIQVLDGGDRNVIAHGGRFIADIDTIKAHAFQSERVARWQMAFEAKYGVSFEQTIKTYEAMQPQFIDTLDMRAGALTLRAFQDLNHQKDNLKRNIIQKCDNIISSWKTNPTCDLFDGEGMKMYEQLVSEWNSIYYEQCKHLQCILSLLPRKRGLC